MFLIFTLLVFLLADVGAQGASHTLLFDETMKTVFQNAHESMDKTLEWKDVLSKRALEKSLLLRDAYTVPEKRMVLVGAGAFGSSDDMAKKLNDSLTQLLQKNEQEILQYTQYGCGGYATTWEEGGGFMNYACIYRNKFD